MSMRKYARTPGPIGNRNHPSNQNWTDYDHHYRVARDNNVKRYNRKRLMELVLETVGLLIFILIMMLVVGWAS